MLEACVDMNKSSKTLRLLAEQLKEGFLGGFLILSCVIFIIGFLAGMLAIFLIPAKPDVAAFGFAVFVCGLLIGIVIIVLLQVIIKWNRLRKRSEPS